MKSEHFDKEALAEEIEDLQSRLAFFEDLLNGLNTRVAAQDQEIVELRFQVKHLSQKLQGLSEAAEAGAGTDVPPPHY